MSPQKTSLRAQFEESLHFDTLIADLSSNFVNLPASEVDREILEDERLICETLRFDIAALGEARCVNLS